MRMGMMALAVAVLVSWAGMAEARERSIRKLPKDVLSVAFFWTEPLKEFAEHTRRFDPIRGVWSGLVNGSVKSVQRTARFFFVKDTEPDAHGKQSEGILHYSF